MADKKRPARVEIHPAVLAGIEKHAYSNLEAEVGGVLYGSISGKNTVIIGSVPATKASAEQMTLTFTHEVWDDIYKQGEKNFPGNQIVGWYHTHPSFGLFLSEYDQFIQKNFFANFGQLALVIDPIAGNMGWFELKKNEIVMFHEEVTKVGPKPRDEKVAALVGRKSALTAVGAALVATALTWGLTSAFAAPDFRGVYSQAMGELTSTRQAVLDLQAQLGMTERGFSFQYTVRDGDTKASIAEMFYSSSEQIASLVRDNPALESAEPEVGSQVVIVDAVGMNWIPKTPTQEAPTPPVVQPSTAPTEEAPTPQVTPPSTAPTVAPTSNAPTTPAQETN